MEASNRNTPSSGVGQIKKVVSKVIVITPKQIAEMGLENQIKNIKKGTVIGEIRELKSGDGTPIFKPVKAALLNNLRTKMSTLLNHSPLVMRVDPEKAVDLGHQDADGEACEAAEVIEISNDTSSDSEEENVLKGKDVEILSNRAVHYTSNDLKLMLDEANTQSQRPKSQSVILNNNQLLQKKIVSNSSKSENLLCVADLTPVAASQITTISSESDREQTPEREVRDAPVRKDIIDLDALIAAKQVIKNAAARNIRTVPKTFAPSAFRDQQVVRTYSKVQSISVVGGPKRQESHKRVIRIHKRGSRTAEDDDEDWVSPKRPYKRRKSKSFSTVNEKDLQLSVEEKVRRIMDECKEKESGEQATPVAPKKRGRPRKTPLQPKVDIEPESEKDKNDASEKTETPTPRKRGRPRKVSADAPKDDKSSDDNSPKKKQRRRKSHVDEKEYSAPSSNTGGIRTSGRKRKVVDYAALSGGRISSSEEEDFAEIERLTGIKHESSEEESDDEIQREESKEKTPSKTEAVHPLKKRLKMEHAQAAEKEKLEDASEEKKPDEKDDETDKHETNDVRNNAVKKSKDTEPPQADDKVEKSVEKPTNSASTKEENQNSAHKDEKVNDTVLENNTSKANADIVEKKSVPEANDTAKSESKGEAPKSQDNQSEDHPSETKKDVNRDSQSDITCDVCKETLESETEWVKHKEGRHNNLAWKVGEPALDLENYDLVCKTLTVTLKKYGTLVCEVCGLNLSGAVTFVKHTRKCRNACFDYDVKAGIDGESAKSRRSGAPGASMVDIIKTIVPKLSQTIQNNLSSGNKENGNAAKKKTTVRKISGEVQCAVCQEMMPNGRWLAHRETKHNNLAWREGEEPMDLEDHKLVVRVLTAMYKQKKPLRCENCGQKKKSVIGFISHKQQCQKSAEELKEIRVVCYICHRTMLPVSMPVHMQLYHSSKEAEKPKEEELSVLTPRKAAKKAIDMMLSYRELEPSATSDVLSLKRSRKVIKDVDFMLSDEVFNKFQDDINFKTYATCVYENCRYQTENIDDLMEHLSSCDNKTVTSAFTCNYCLATYGCRKDAYQHLEVHGNKTEADYVLKDIIEDKNFIAEDEGDLDPLEYLDNEIGCEVGQVSLSQSKPCSKFLISKVKFMRDVTSYKNSWSLFPFAYDWTNKFVLENFNVNNLFPHYRTRGNQIKAVAPEDVVGYLPKLRRSIDVARLSLNKLENPVEQDYTWKSYKLFEAEIFSDGSSAIFCGGPVNCLAWVPTPHTELNRDQILSVSVLDPGIEYSKINKHLHKSLIQFWNFGPLTNNSTTNFTPKLEFCIAHKYGTISSLEWCPSGCYDSQVVMETELKRLGLLAVASGDSFIYIYAVIHPDQIRGKVLEYKPLLKLSLSKVLDAEIGDLPYFPTKISWTKHAGHNHIAAGYMNGIVALYSLDKLGENVSKDEVPTLYPIQSFNAHYENIIALALSHLSGGNRFLITASSYKDLKLWDLEDTSDAIFVNRKCPIIDLTWNIHWLSVMVCYDNVHSTVASLVPLRDHNGFPTSLIPFNSRVTSVTSNDWGNLYIGCSDSGEVTAYMADQLNEKYDADRRKRKPRCLLSYTGIISKNLTPHENKAIQNNRFKQFRDKKVTPENIINFGPQSYADAKNNYALAFCDMNTNVKWETTGPSNEHKKLLGNINYYSMHKPDLYPIQSITKSVLNQNMQSFHYYALGYHVGFVRVSKIGFLNKSL